MRILGRNLAVVKSGTVECIPGVVEGGAVECFVSLLLLLMGFFPGWPMGEKAVALDVEGRWLQIGAKAMVACSQPSVLDIGS